MKQLDLLSIQPVSVREIVSDRLRGLEYRQQAREARRKRENERAAARRILRDGKKRPAKQAQFPNEEQEIPRMRQIKVVYRAVFQQLKSVAMVCRAPVNVEVVESGGKWISRSADTGVSFHFAECQSAEAAKKEAESRFQLMLSDGWWMLGKPPEGPGSELRMLDPEEFTMKDGRCYWYELNDYTHIADPKRPMNGSSASAIKICPAACGESPSVKQIISTKANIEPSCPQCAEVYRKEYAHK